MRLPPRQLLALLQRCAETEAGIPLTAYLIRQAEDNPGPLLDLMTIGPDQLEAEMNVRLDLLIPGEPVLAGLSDDQIPMIERLLMLGSWLALPAWRFGEHVDRGLIDVLRRLRAMLDNPVQLKNRIDLIAARNALRASVRDVAQRLRETIENRLSAEMAKPLPTSAAELERAFAGEWRVHPQDMNWETFERAVHFGLWE